MFVGAFKRDSKISKRLRSIRKEYSIIGFILLIPHFIIYLNNFINGDYPWEWYGIFAMIIMIPLFTTSFNIFKKKINMKNWKKLQRLSYIVYALIFIHLMIVGSGENVIVYGTLFSLYTYLKIKNYLLNKEEQSLKTMLNIGYAFVLGLYLFNTTGVAGNLFSTSYEGADYNMVSLNDGIYRGEGTGFQGLEVDLDVVVENGEIADIIIYEYGGTTPHKGIDFEVSASLVANEIILNQSTNIDTISGATKTSEGILEAVKDALK
jgi:uncharacterized protein with FMN-binding domain